MTLIHTRILRVTGIDSGCGTWGQTVWPPYSQLTSSVTLRLTRPSSVHNIPMKCFALMSVSWDGGPPSMLAHFQWKLPQCSRKSVVLDSSVGYSTCYWGYFRQVILNEICQQLLNSDWMPGTMPRAFHALSHVTLPTTTQERFTCYFYFLLEETSSVWVTNLSKV